MSFSTVINLGTVSAAITQVKLYECTGNNTGCTGLTGYTAVDVNTFPITVTGITDNMEYIKVEALGTCAGTIQSLVISGKPGTPTPTPTATGTPTPTPTATPTVTPTPTPTTNCVTSVQFEVVTGGDVRYVDCCGNTEYANVGAGPEVINGCIQNGSLFQVGASITDISYGGSPCSCDATPTPLSFTVTTGCTNYQGTLSVNLEGGTGTGYYWSIISGPVGYPTGNQSDNATVTGLSNGNYAILVGDSDGANQSTNEIYNVTCASAPNNTASANLVIQSLKPTSAECASGTPYTFDLGSPSATFCTATRYTALGLTTLGTGNNFWLCYEGQTRQVFHPSNAGYFDQAGGCQTL